MLVLLAAVVTGAMAQTTYTDPLTVPLTMEALTDGNIVVNLMNVGGARRRVSPGSRKRVPSGGVSSNISMKYSVIKGGEGGEKITIYKETETTTITVKAGDKVQFYGDVNSTQFHGDEPKVVLQGTAETKVYGNIMSLIDETGYATLTTLPDGTIANFAGLFSGNENLTDASGLLLPVTTLTVGCYYGMFAGCTSLTTAPALPAPALAEQCYFMMFLGCTSLNSVTCMATNISAEDCTTGWLYGVAPTGTFIKASGATWPTGNNGIPSGWTVYDGVTLTDGEAITALDTYKGQEKWVNYTRSFTKGKTSTVCLPFDYTKKAGDGSFYAFTNIEKVGSEYVATMTEPGTTTLEANTPYLYLPNATGNVDFSGPYTIPASLTAGSTTSNGWTFKGTFTTIEWTTAPTGTYGFSAGDYSGQGISQGQFVKVGENVSIKPMRCYLENASFVGARGINRTTSADEQLPETIKVRLVSASGEVTAIGSLQTKTGKVTLDGDAWYTLDGRRITGKPGAKGIYINNNKKVIVK